jgi:hypothetical protein
MKHEPLQNKWDESSIVLTQKSSRTSQYEPITWRQIICTIKEQAGEKRSTICTHGYANFLLKNAPTKHNKYVVNQTLEYIDNIGFRIRSFHNSLRSHKDHYGMRHTALWSCTHIPNIIDLSGKTKKLWSGQASLRKSRRNGSGRKNQTKTICLPSFEEET